MPHVYDVIEGLSSSSISILFRRNFEYLLLFTNHVSPYQNMSGWVNQKNISLLPVYWSVCSSSWRGWNGIGHSSWSLCQPPNCTLLMISFLWYYNNSITNTIFWVILYYKIQIKYISWGLFEPPNCILFMIILLSYDNNNITKTRF